MSNRRREEHIPQSDSAPQFERAIIAYTLTNADAFYDVSDKLQPHHFFIVRHARIWAAMQKCIAAGKKPERRMVRLYMPSADSKDDTSFELFTGALMHELRMSTDQFDFAVAVKTVVTLGDRRQIVRSMEESILKIRAMDPGAPTEDVVDEAVRSITVSTGREFDADMQTYGQFAEQVSRRISSVIDDETVGVGLHPGLKGVEEVMGPLIGGKVYVLAGMSSGGKSALAKSITEAAAKDAKRKGLGHVYIASLEMAGQEHAARSLADFLGIPAFKIERASVNRGEMDRIHTVGREYMASLPIIIDQRRRMSMETIRSRMQQVKFTRGLAMGVIDHVLLIRPSRDKDSLMDRVMEAVIEAKIMAGEFNIPILLLAQINEKNLLDRPSGWPIASDLFGGASLVQNADSVIFIHRPEQVLRKKEPAKGATEKHDQWMAQMEREKGRAWVFSDKSRGMEGGLKRELTFDGEFMRFTDRI